MASGLAEVCPRRQAFSNGTLGSPTSLHEGPSLTPRALSSGGSQSSLFQEEPVRSLEELVHQPCGGHNPWSQRPKESPRPLAIMHDSPGAKTRMEPGLGAHTCNLKHIGGWGRKMTFQASLGPKGDAILKSNKPKAPGGMLSQTLL